MLRRLLIQNGLAVIAVVLYHSTAWGFTSLFWWTHRYRDVTVPNFDQLGSITYYGLRFFEQIVVFGVPTFMFVTGYFIAIATRPEQKTIEWRIILSRVKSLIIPFVLWSVFILAVRWVEGERYSGGEALLTIITGRTSAPYYYVPQLIQLFLLAPFIVPIARKWPVGLVIFAIVFHLFVGGVRYLDIVNIETGPVLKLLIRSWFFTSYFMWISLGITAGFHLPAIKSFLGRIKKYLPFLVIIFFLLGMLEWETLLRLSGEQWIGPRQTLVDDLYAAAFIFTFLAYDQFKPPFSTQLADFGVKSYGIYLMHAPVLEFSSRLVYHLLPGLLAYQIIFQPLLVVLGMGLPVVVMNIVNKTPARVFYKYLFG